MQAYTLQDMVRMLSQNHHFIHSLLLGKKSESLPPRVESVVRIPSQILLHIKPYVQIVLDPSITPRHAPDPFPHQPDIQKPKRRCQ